MEKIYICFFFLRLEPLEVAVLEKDVSKTACHVRLPDLLPSCHAVSVMKLIRLPANSTEVCQGALEALICATKDDLSACLSPPNTPAFEHACAGFSRRGPGHIHLFILRLVSGFCLSHDTAHQPSPQRVLTSRRIPSAVCQNCSKTDCKKMLSHLV